MQRELATNSWNDEMRVRVLNLRAEGKTLQEVGDIFGVGAGRITQVQKQAWRKCMYYLHRRGELIGDFKNLSPKAKQIVMQRWKKRERERKAKKA